MTASRQMSDLAVILTAQAVLLIGGMIFAFRAGRQKEKNETIDKKSKAEAAARKARSDLDNPAVVKRLHDAYKRRVL